MGGKGGWERGHQGKGRGETMDGSVGGEGWGQGQLPVLQEVQWEFPSL